MLKKRMLSALLCLCLVVGLGALAYGAELGMRDAAVHSPMQGGICEKDKLL